MFTKQLGKIVYSVGVGIVSLTGGLTGVYDAHTDINEAIKSIKRSVDIVPDNIFEKYKLRQHVHCDYIGNIKAIEFVERRGNNITFLDERPVVSETLFIEHKNILMRKYITYPIYGTILGFSVGIGWPITVPYIIGYTKFLSSFSDK